MGRCNRMQRFPHVFFAAPPKCVITFVCAHGRIRKGHSSLLRVLRAPRNSPCVGEALGTRPAPRICTPRDARPAIRKASTAYAQRKRLVRMADEQIARRIERLEAAAECCHEALMERRGKLDNLLARPPGGAFGGPRVPK